MRWPRRSASTRTRWSSPSSTGWPPIPLPGAGRGLLRLPVCMAGDAAELGFDPGRLAVYGGSAGGGLTIAITMLARDRGGAGDPLPDAGLPHDRRQERDPVRARDHRRRAVGPRGQHRGLEVVPRRRKGRSVRRPGPRGESRLALPSTFIDVGTVDLFRDEDIAFAQRLMQAGAPTELHVNPGSYHAAEVFAPDCALSQRIWTRRFEALRRGLALTSVRPALQRRSAGSGRSRPEHHRDSSSTRTADTRRQTAARWLPGRA